MAAQTLSAEHLETIREFMLSEAAELVFGMMEAGIINDWVNCHDPAERETCWRNLQAVLLLKFYLRDAAAMKRLTERTQERRIYSS